MVAAGVPVECGTVGTRRVWQGEYQDRVAAEDAAGNTKEKGVRAQKLSGKWWTAMKQSAAGPDALGPPLDLRLSSRSCSPPTTRHFFELTQFRGY